MSTNSIAGGPLTLGAFLRDRRERLTPEAGAQGRRRTPGLRREEVAARAGVSVTWYTWLEQGRGGAPSDEVLEQLASALELDAVGREVLFLLAQQRPPPLKTAPSRSVSTAVQRVLDSLRFSPAYVKTPAWDIVAWNAAALEVLTPGQSGAHVERNVLKRLFSPSSAYRARPDWESDARFALASFRVDVARAGDCPEAVALAAQLQATSADFRRLWAENEIVSHWSGVKRFDHPVAGPLTFEYSTFSVDGAEGLSMIVFTPVTPADEAAVAELLRRTGDAQRTGASDNGHSHAAEASA
jgi:transcriptional regulator with XRE-family HTH domain